LCHCVFVVKAVAANAEHAWWMPSLQQPGGEITFHAMSEIIFEVREDEADGGYNAAALGHDIFTEGDTLSELRANVRDAVQCHFGDGVPGPLPQVIRLHFVRDEVLAL